MIFLKDKLALEDIYIEDHAVLLRLMKDIYPPVYSHLWEDNGEAYVQKIYSKENLESELQQENAYYYFIKCGVEKIGILRILDNESMPDLSNTLMVKLHRIYLAPCLHGQGLGTAILNWIEHKFCKANKKALWLEVMDTQRPAILFYEKFGFVKKAKFTFDSDAMIKRYRGMYRMIKDLS